MKKLKSQGGGVEVRDAKDEVGMIAGGSGITPMLQIVREMLREGQASGCRRKSPFCTRTKAKTIFCAEIRWITLKSSFEESEGCGTP